MPGGNGNRFFDTDLFWEDVKKYKERWEYTWKDMARIGHVDRDTIPLSMYQYNCHNIAPSLYVVSYLASLCDLDLNRYVKDILDEV